MTQLNQAAKQARPHNVLEYARLHGYQIHDEAFGRRGRSIEIWFDGKFLAQRKSWQAALNFIQYRDTTQEALAESGADTTPSSAQMVDR